MNRLSSTRRSLPAERTGKSPWGRQDPGGPGPVTPRKGPWGAEGLRMGHRGFVDNLRDPGEPLGLQRQQRGGPTTGVRATPVWTPRSPGGRGAALPRLGRCPLGRLPAHVFIPDSLSRPSPGPHALLFSFTHAAFCSPI